MALSLTDAEWTDLGSKLFLMQPASATKLPKPVTTPGAYPASSIFSRPMITSTISASG